MDLNLLLQQLKDAGKLTDFLFLLSESQALFNCNTEQCLPEGPYGNIFRRQMVLNKIGTQFEGHVHHYDHVTYLIRGKVLRQIKETPDSEPIEHIFEAPSAMLIRADCYHKFTALSEDVIAECVYALRNSKTGEITEKWDGGMGPYV